MPDLSTWPFERLQGLTAGTNDWSQLESVRVVAQQHAYDSNRSYDARRRWAELSLLANRRMLHRGVEGSTRELRQEFALRTWVIEYLGPDDDNSAWSPDALGADTLATLRLSPLDAAASAGNWIELPIEQIRELRRYKNLTAHLERLVGHLRPGPTRDLLLLWIETRELLP
ncbi:hypothetical protein [Streptomyces sp. CAI-85]|uniref:hypothetical protein n=1 Tax=Streptomyces sp. CAI-85 TaxID=1472662 RepID=UPI001587C06F|nr:hypothetical protein [Streptomyces sp. CAI-85]NUV61168.1 hypothetical protein [Streptomyces sp. CAI-85]